MAELQAAEGTARRGVFVGRERELAAAREALDDALAGHGRLLLVAGEPGIGKSRLADELSEEARARGARVLWGRCWEAGGAPAYWPWVQAIRAYVRERDPAALRAELRSGAADVVQMLPELRELVDEPPGPPPDSESARFRLFDSTSRLLQTIAAERPLVVVLDDLHAADAPSLLLLQFVAGQLGASRLLLVGAYRDLGLVEDHPLTATLAELLREQPTRLLSLSGVDASAVARYVELSAEIDPPGSLVRAIHAKTDGNPLFFGELIRLLASEGRLDAGALARRPTIPQTVRDVIERRLRQLSDECLGVLTLASVLGRELALDALTALTEHDEEALDAVLDEAFDARVLAEVPDALGRLRFSHGLIRDALYEDLSPGRRRTLHRRSGEVLEALYAHDPKTHMAELALHFFEATPGGDPSKAIDYARRAGDSAVGLLAFEEAARLYQMALEVVELTGAEDETARCELLLRLGDAQGRAGDLPTARDTFLRAADVARERELPGHLARAALGYGGRFVWEPGRGDRRLCPLLEEALEALGARDPALRARLLARLAGGPLRDMPDRARRMALSEQAVELARQVDCPETLAYALDGRFTAMFAVDNLGQRLGVASELVEAAHDAGDKERELQGHHYRCLTLVELGDLPGAYVEMEAQAHLAEELRQPAQQWYVTSLRATLATFEGRLAEADILIQEALALGRDAQGSMAPTYHTIQSYLLRREQGRLDEVELAVRSAAAEVATYPVLGCVLAHVQAELGRHETARQMLEHLLPDGSPELHIGQELFGMCLLADVSHSAGDTGRAAALYETLLPYGGRNALSPPAGCIGSVSRSLGVLATTIGLPDEADRHFEDAIEMNARSGAQPWVAQAQLDHARALLALGDHERAAELLGAALETGRRLDAAALAAKASEALAGLRPPSPTASEACVFRREGDYWAIAYKVDSFRLKHAKGLGYLAELLAHPGVELHALALAGDGGGRGRTIAAGRRSADDALASSGVGDAGALLDGEARRAYRRRLEELAQELDEAERFGDPERSARARAESQFLTDELAAAVGLGGRVRRAAGPAERARQSVTKAIKAALRRIEEQSPALAGHLAATVHTGAACAYRPDPHARIEWRL